MAGSSASTLGDKGFSSSESEKGSSEDESYKPDEAPKRKVSGKGTAVVIPADILKSKKLTSIATRMKITPSKQIAYTKALIDEIGGQSSQVFTSYGYAVKHRKSVNLSENHCLYASI